MAMADSDTSRLWQTAVFLGVGVGLALGMIVVLFKRTGQSVFGQMLAAPAPMPVAAQLGAPIVNEIGGHKSAARTVTVDTTPTQVLRALGSRPWRLQVRAVSPPGGVAVFAGSNNPSEGITLNTGDYQEMWLSPGEDLYVQSKSGQVVISASGGEAV